MAKKTKFTYDPDTLREQRAILTELSKLSCVPNVVSIKGVAIKPNSKQITVTIGRATGKFSIRDEKRYEIGKKEVLAVLKSHDNVIINIDDD